MTAATDRAAVCVRGLSVQHPGTARCALLGVDLQIAPGERLVLLGPSGAGKTTLLHALLGEGPADGEVRVGGRDPYDPRQRRAVRRGTGTVLQGADLVPGQRVRTAAVSGCSHLLTAPGWWAVARRRTPAHLADRLSALAHEQGLAHLLDRQVRELSGGERQRVALVRALLGRPGLLLADEPTAGLDPTTAASAVAALLDQPTTLVVTTHDPAVAARFDRVVALRGGRVVHDGPALSAEQARELYAREAHRGAG